MVPLVVILKPKQVDLIPSQEDLDNLQPWEKSGQGHEFTEAHLQRTSAAGWQQLSTVAI
jgi:hypothetical protein